MKIVDVVAALIEREGKLLLARRDATGDQVGLWEFPGGKVEAGESQQAANCRKSWGSRRRLQNLSRPANCNSPRG